MQARKASEPEQNGVGELRADCHHDVVVGALANGQLADEFRVSRVFEEHRAVVASDCDRWRQTKVDAGLGNCKP